MSVTDIALGRTGAADQCRRRPTPAGAPTKAIVSADTPDGPADRAQAGFFAELASHRNAATPFCLALFGPAGAAKSSLLAATLEAVSRLGEAAADVAGAPVPPHGHGRDGRSPPGTAPALSMVGQVFAALAPIYPAAPRRCEPRR